MAAVLELPAGILQLLLSFVGPDDTAAFSCASKSAWAIALYSVEAQQLWRHWCQQRWGDLAVKDWNLNTAYAALKSASLCECGVCNAIVALEGAGASGSSSASSSRPQARADFYRYYAFRSCTWRTPCSPYDMYQERCTAPFVGGRSPSSSVASSGAGAGAGAALATAEGKRSSSGSKAPQPLACRSIDPWRLVSSCVLRSRTSGGESIESTVAAFHQAYGTPSAVARACGLGPVAGAATGAGASSSGASMSTSGSTAASSAVNTAVASSCSGHTSGLDAMAALLLPLGLNRERTIGRTALAFLSPAWGHCWLDQRRMEGQVTGPGPWSLAGGGASSSSSKGGQASSTSTPIAPINPWLDGPSDPCDLPGCGPFTRDSWLVFCHGAHKRVAADVGADRNVRAYAQWCGKQAVIAANAAAPGPVAAVAASATTARGRGAAPSSSSAAATAVHTKATPAAPAQGAKGTAAGRKGAKSPVTTAEPAAKGSGVGKVQAPASAGRLSASADTTGRKRARAASPQLQPEDKGQGRTAKRKAQESSPVAKKRGRRGGGSR